MTTWTLAEVCHSVVCYTPLLWEVIPLQTLAAIGESKINAFEKESCDTLFRAVEDAVRFCFVWFWTNCLSRCAFLRDIDYLPVLKINMINSKGLKTNSLTFVERLVQKKKKKKVPKRNIACWCFREVAFVFLKISFFVYHCSFYSSFCYTVKLSRRESEKGGRSRFCFLCRKSFFFRAFFIVPKLAGAAKGPASVVVLINSCTGPKFRTFTVETRKWCRVSRVL